MLCSFVGVRATGSMVNPSNWHYERASNLWPVDLHEAMVSSRPARMAALAPDPVNGLPGNGSSSGGSGGGSGSGTPVGNWVSVVWCW